ncbi:MAG TPA: ABC transporter permease [Vicinamibacterales bacterium]|jgi:predicted permease|nr:ABC transporter permease [Vicinamibacterales bacterium]
MRTLLSRFVGGLRALFQPQRTELELDDELRAYLDEAVERKMADGLSREDATRTARAEMGSVAAVKDDVRDVGWESLVDTLWQDVRYGIRTLGRSPGFTAVAVLTLAIGIGANTAIFTVINSLLLRNLPVAEPDRLVRIVAGTVDTTRNTCVWPTCQDLWTYATWEQVRLRTDLFDGAFAYSSGGAFNLGTAGEMQSIEGLFVSGTFFSTLGVPALVGRTFTSSDDVPGGGLDGPVAVISYRCWQRRFGGAADVIGQSLVIEGVRFSIIGVTPPEFFGLEVGRAFEVAVPVGTDTLIRGADSMMRSEDDALRIMIRLKPGQSLEEATTTLRAVQPEIRTGAMPKGFPELEEGFLTHAFTLLPAGAGTSSMRLRYEMALLTIFAVVVVVLLIACANVGNLLLARGTSRRQELSLRVALGAGRGRVVRQLLVESLLLAGGGALVGLILAGWGCRGLMALLPAGLTATPFLDVSFDWRVLAFTAMVSLVTATLFGIAPALRATRVAPIDALRHHGRASAFGGSVSGSLVVAQIALSLALVVAAGLLVRTFARLGSVALGFDSDRVLLVVVDAQRVPIDPVDRPRFFQKVVDTVRAVPGVSHAAGSMFAPVSGTVSQMRVDVPGGAVLPEGERVSLRHFITPGWFRTYGTPVHAGRDLDERDNAGAQPVVLVNEAFVRRFFPDGNAVGRTVTTARNDLPVGTRTIIGVAGDATYRSLREERQPTIYLPLAQWNLPFPLNPRIFISVRPVAGSPMALAPSVATAIAGVDRNAAFMFRSLEDQVYASIAQERFVAMLSGLFGVLALLLAGLGLYGITAYAVARRRSEIGVRIALGAGRADIMRLVIGRSLGVTAAGIVIGLAAAALATRFLGRLLFGVTPLDPATFVAVALLFIVVTTLAAFLPARRATTVDPLIVLRSE